MPQTGPCFAPVFADSSFFITPISCGVGSLTFTGPFCEDSAGWCTDPAGDITSGVGSRLTISGPFSAESFAWTNFSVFFDLFTDTNFATNSDTWCNSLQTGIASGVGSHNFLGPDFKYFATYSELGGAPTLICIAITADWVTSRGWLPQIFFWPCDLSSCTERCVWKLLRTSTHCSTNCSVESDTHCRSLQGWLLFNIYWPGN